MLLLLVSMISTWLLTPALTTVHSQIEEVALADEIVIEHYSHGEQVCQETRLPTHLVIRQIVRMFVIWSISHNSRKEGVHE
jgi:DNA-binding LacI/PurR family transcriptional regulator